MPNPLTGDFDAVVQISLRQINGLLATLHQNGADADSVLRLLHSVRTRVGDTKRRPPDLTAFGDWVLEYQTERPAGPRAPIRDLLVSTLPPGAAKRIDSAFADLDLVIEPLPPESVRGTAAVQLSTVRISVADGSTSEITVHVDVRAHYDPDPDTAALPEPVHGEVRAAFDVTRSVAGGKTRLIVRPSSQDQKIEFIPDPGSGLSTLHASHIAAQVRKIVREEISLLPIDLPGGFPFSDFKGLGSGTGAAIALPLQLTDAPPPPGGVQSITQSIVGNSGFAFGVSREFVQGLIDVEAIREAIKARRIRFRVSVFGHSAQVVYRLRFTSGPTLTFVAGAIEVAGRVAVETSTWWAPNGFVSFKQRLKLVLDTSSQRVGLETDGDPSVDKSFFIPRSTAVNAVKAEIANAVSANAPAVRRVFQDAKASLVSALRTFEASASARYTQIEVSPNGVIVRGEIPSAARIAPIIEIGETNQRKAFTAFQSWIPGGRIDRFLWSWVEYPGHRPSPWSGVARSVTETARFSLEKPAGINEISQICLRVSGKRILPDGSTQNVVAGSVCDVGEPVIAFDAPSWWEPVMVPVWMPDLPETTALRDGIMAHVGVQADRPQRAPMQNALVLFTDLQSTAPVETLVRGMEPVRRGSAQPAVFMILPKGSFDLTRREIETRLAALPPAIVRVLQIVEDTQGGWARMFDVEKAPALFLINSRREFVWKAVGALDPSEIAAALDHHITAAPEPRFRPLRLKVPVGGAAPDVFFHDDRGIEGALHRLGGRSVVFTFWQSWSSPCLAELRRLQTLIEADEHGDPVVVAFHGGDADADFEAIRKEHRLTFAMVQDAEQKVARAFGVRCWPTTISIGPDGRIEHIRQGFERDVQRKGL